MTVSTSMPDIKIRSEALPKIRSQRAHINKAHDLGIAVQLDVLKDWAGISERLPEDLVIKDVTEIGCGIGVLAAVIHHHIPGVKFHLIDGDGDDPKQLGFQASMEPYNDMAASRDFLSDNGVTVASTHEANKPFNAPCDLCVSLGSCGYHYPIQTYIDSIAASLRPGGVLVFDIRIGTDGAYRAVKAGMSSMGIIPKELSYWVKGERHMFRKLK